MNEQQELKEKVTKLCRKDLNAKCLHIQQLPHPGDAHLWIVLSISLDNEGYLPQAGDKPYMVHYYNAQTHGLFHGHYCLGWIESRETFYNKLRLYTVILEEVM